MKVILVKAQLRQYIGILFESKRSIINVYIYYIAYIQGYVEVRALRIRQRERLRYKLQEHDRNFTATSNTRKRENEALLFDGLFVSGAKF